MNLRSDLAWLTARPIAHRGLHDGASRRPENSMAAFAAAIAGEYAIECDLQPSADGVPMVFHDDDLERLTGEPGNIRDRPRADLARLKLAVTSESIPTLADLLEQTDGKVPLIIELKSQPGRDSGFAAKVCRALIDYHGPVAVMSFDIGLIGDTRTSAPTLPCGLTAEGDWTDCAAILKALLRYRLQFLSYAINDLPTPAPWFARTVLRLPLICWTVRTEDQRRRAARWSDQITFEGFTP